MEYTPEQIAKHYAAALDSVSSLVAASQTE